MKNQLILLLLLHLTNSFAQPIYTKDSVVYGDRKDFEKECMKTPKSKIVTIKGVEIQYVKYCMCVCDNVIPRLYSWEIDKAIKDKALLDLFTNDQNIGYLYECFSSNAEVKDDCKISNSLTSDKLKDFGVKNCVNSMLKNDTIRKLFSDKDVLNLCECAIEKMSNSNFTKKDIDLMDENGEFFNEIMIQCVNDIIDGYSTDTLNRYNANDISGETPLSKIPLLNSIDKSYKVKITIGGIAKYFILDTGASDLIIDRNFEMELILKGFLNSGNYIGKTKYSLANNEMVEADLIKINDIKFGDYTVNNVTLSVVKNGSLLCGVGFLNKFKSWKIDKANKLLILYR